MHAAHVGSAWQVETWEAVSLIPVYTALDDVDAMTRVTARLEELARTVPSLKFYARLARHALTLLLSHSPEEIVAHAKEVTGHAPRSYIGWATTQAFAARAFNQIGDHASAKAICEASLLHVDDADREYVTLFLHLDIEMAHAEAGLGQSDRGFSRIDALLVRFRESKHPLVQGLLHEARAKIAWAAGRLDEYDVSRITVERWFRPTGTPALIAKCERLTDLRWATASGRSRWRTPTSSPTRHPRGSRTRRARTDDRESRASRPRGRLRTGLPFWSGRRYGPTISSLPFTKSDAQAAMVRPPSPVVSS
jgi:hypothetical protein